MRWPAMARRHRPKSGRNRDSLLQVSINNLLSLGRNRHGLPPSINIVRHTSNIAFFEH